MKEEKINMRLLVVKYLNYLGLQIENLKVRWSKTLIVDENFKEGIIASGLEPDLAYESFYTNIEQ